jgi:pilus assembly protein FimV
VKTVDFRKKVILSHFLLNVLFVCVLMSSWVTQAAGLGNLNVGSYLGQPFKAEIALVSVKKGEIASLSARLASPEAFQKAGINFADYLSTLSVSIEKRADGQPYLQLSSPQAINEPFLNILIELNSPSGRVLREYTVLLDPAETQKTTSATPVLQSGVDGESLEDAPSATPQESVVIQSERTDWIGETYGPVSQGDTLTRIARQVSPKDVDLNQMLVALYRANRDAFIEKNMNLLRVGVILRIPDESEISTIAPKEAVREVKLQTENWNIYRRRVADAAASMPGDSESRQSLTGKISTVTEKSAPSGMSRAEEVLILSKGELLGIDQQATKGAGNDSAQNYVRMMEEDAIAKERALEEANERVTMLEQNIAKLQRLLELKGSTTEAQTRIEQGQPRSELDPLPTSVKGTQTEPTSATTVSPAQGAKDSTLPEFTIPAQSVVAESLVNPALQSEYLESDSPSLLATFVDLTMDNVELLGGALAALLVIWLSASIIRRKSEKTDDFDEIEEAYSYTAEQDVMASATDAGGASEKENSGHIRAEFDLPAEESSDQPKFNNTKEADEDPAVAASGFFFGKKLDESDSTDRQSDDDSETEKLKNESTDAFGGSATSGHEIKFDTERVEPELNKPAEQLSSDVQQNDEDIKWNFTDQDIDLSIERNDSEEEISAAERNAGFQEGHEIEFEQDSPKAPDDTTQKSHSLDEFSKLESSFADIDLDLGEESKKASGIEYSDDDNTHWQEVATKIDLAKAYLEMDDQEGAKEILEEVLREGDSEQQAAARSMLDEIN